MFRFLSVVLATLAVAIILMLLVMAFTYAVTGESLISVADPGLFTMLSILVAGIALIGARVLDDVDGSGD